MCAGTITPSDAGTITISGLIQLNDEPLGRRRRGHLHALRARLAEEDLAGTVHERERVGHLLFIGREHHLVAAFADGELRARAARDRHLPEIAVERRGLARVEVETLLVARERDVVHLPLAARERAAVAAVGRGGPELRAARGLGAEVDAAVVVVEADAAEVARAARPRRVAQRLDDLHRAGCRVDHRDLARLEVVRVAEDDGRRAGIVPGDDVRVGGVRLFARDRLEPLHVAARERLIAEARRVLRVADFRAVRDVLGVAARGHVVGDVPGARVGGRGRRREQHRAAVGAHRDVRHTLVRVERDGLRAGRRARGRFRAANGIRARDVPDRVEQFELVGVEPAPLRVERGAASLWRGRRTAPAATASTTAATTARAAATRGSGRAGRVSRANVGELYRRAVRDVDGPRVAVAHEHHLLSVRRESRVRLGSRGLGEMPRSRAPHVDEIQVAGVRDDLHGAIPRIRAVRDERADRIDLRRRHQLGLCAGLRANAIRLERVAEIGAGRKPLEIDPLAVGRPANLRRLAAVHLGAAHHVLDGELELGGRLGEQHDRRERETPDGRSKMEDGRPKTEDRRPKTEDRRWKKTEDM